MAFTPEEINVGCEENLENLIVKYAKDDPNMEVIGDEIVFHRSKTAEQFIYEDAEYEQYKKDIESGVKQLPIEHQEYLDRAMKNFDILNDKLIEALNGK